MDNSKYMFIIAGAPGSGKSTLAKRLMDNSCKFINTIVGNCEADDYFYIMGDGKYAFNPKLLWKAHKWCQNKAEKMALNGSNFIVSNTGINPKDRGFYFNLARNNGYQVVFIHLKNNYGSIHDVPEDVIKRMTDNFVDLTSVEKSIVVSSENLTDELASLLAVVGVDYEY